MARDQVMTPAEPKMPRFTGWLRPMVDAVARVKAGVHRKLLFGFLIGALLLVAMGLLSLLVIRQMNDRMIELDDAQLKAGRAQEMLYAVTAQSHYRAMALLLPGDAAKYNGQVEDAKENFAQLLDELHRAEPANAAYERVSTVNERYRQSGQKVLQFIGQGRTADATYVHLYEEHPISHQLETQMNTLIDTANEDMARAQADFRTSRDLFTGMVIAFSAVSVIVALMLGFVLSWAFILPVRKMERALTDITAGNFDQRVDVPNRDEFGGLARGLNSTSERLATLFDEQRRLATRLGETNLELDSALQESLRELQRRAEELQASRARVVAAADAERRKIERNLHDGAQQHLVALAMMVRLAQQVAATDPERARDLLTQLGQGLKDAVQEMRDVAHGIYPPVLMDRGLVAALESAAARAPLPVEVVANGTMGRFPQEVEAAIYFCCVEALQNASKHAGEGAVATVTIGRDAGADGSEAVMFSVTDDGAGFDPAETAEPGHGFVNMSDRLGAIGGTVEVGSAPGRGTRVWGTVPIDGHGPP
jgi:signal transduction histidine kinase